MVADIDAHFGDRGVDARGDIAEAHRDNAADHRRGLDQRLHPHLVDLNQGAPPPPLAFLLGLAGAALGVGFLVLSLGARVHAGQTDTTGGRHRQPGHRGREN